MLEKILEVRNQIISEIYQTEIRQKLDRNQTEIRLRLVIIRNLLDKISQHKNKKKQTKIRQNQTKIRQKLDNFNIYQTDEEL